MDGLKTKLRKVEHAPYPSAFAKKRARQQIERLAARGEPDVRLLIERADREIARPVANRQTQIHNVPKTGAIGFTETDDAIALLAFVLKDQRPPPWIP